MASNQNTLSSAELRVQPLDCTALNNGVASRRCEWGKARVVTAVTDPCDKFIDNEINAGGWWPHD